MIVVGVTSDWYVKKRKAERGTYKPEDRIPPIAIGTIVMAGGLFMYGWTAERQVH